MSITTITQIAATISNVAIGFIFAYLYWRLLKLQNYTISEMEQQRISGGRPQIIVEADYRRMPEIDLVVRNVGGGPAKSISFSFSANIKSSTGFVLTDLFYLRDGMDFLAPGGEIRCLWDDIQSLEETLEEEGLQHGIRVYARYEGMNGDVYDSDFLINPLLYQGIRNATRKDVDDLVELLEERLPGDDSGDSVGQSPDSAEEFEQQRDNEEHGDQQDQPEGRQGDRSKGRESQEVAENGRWAQEPGSRQGSPATRTTPDWTGGPGSARAKRDERDGD